MPTFIATYRKTYWYITGNSTAHAAYFDKVESYERRQKAGNVFMSEKQALDSLKANTTFIKVARTIGVIVAVADVVLLIAILLILK